MAQFTNQAQLSYNGVTVSSNIAVGEIAEALTVTKTALSSTYRRGDTVGYVISLTNSGTSQIGPLTLTDDLGAYEYGTATLYPLTYVPQSIRLFVNGRLQASPSINSTSPLVIGGVTVPASGNAVIIYESRTNSAAPLDVGSAVTNTVTVSGAVTAADITATEVISAENAPELSISKTIEPVPVSSNGRVTYTIVIQNSGNTSAGADDTVILTDTFSPVLSDITVELDGTVLTEGVSYTYDETTGVFATESGVISVAAASYTRDAQSGLWTVSPGVTTLTVSGNIAS